MPNGEDVRMTQKRRFYGWTLLAIMWLIVFANSFPMSAASVINPHMGTDLHFDRSTLGLIYGVFYWMMGMLGPVVAVIVNKKGVRFTLTAGSLMVVAGAILMATLVHNRWQAVAVFGILIGLAYTASGPLAAQAGIVRWFAREKSRAISLLMTGGSVGGIIAPLMLTRVIAGDPARWRLGWWSVCGFSVAAALLALVGVKERPSDVGQVPDGDAATESAAAQVRAKATVYRTMEDWPYSEVLRSPTFWWLLVPGTGFSVLLPLLMAHIVSHLRDLGHSQTQAALSLSVLSFSMLIGMLWVAAFGDRIEPKRLWATGMLVLAVGVVWAFHASGPVGLYGYALVVGFGFGGATPAAMTMMSNYYGDRPYASIIGFLAVLATTAGAIAAYGAGLVYDHFGSYAGAFYGVALLCFAGFVILLFIKPPVRKAVLHMAAVGARQA